MIQLKHIKKTYGDKGNSCVALQDVSFKIAEGEFVAICGTSGSGKTTLFNIISGVDRKFEGDCYINNTNINTLSDDELTIMRRNQVGIIFQFFNLISYLTVEENIELCVCLDHKKPTKEDILTILTKLHLEDKRRSFIHELSGGQQQRVAIARVMLTKANIVLADEPTGNLDSTNTNTIISIFKQMKEEKKTIVLITHDKKVAEQADRIIYIEDGKVVRNEC